MGELFKYDGWLSKLFRSIVDCVCLSVLWLVSSVPLITIGASTTALCYSVHKCIRNDYEGLWHEYWYSFRMNFKQATVVWCLLVVIYALLLGGCYSTYLLIVNQQLTSAYFFSLLIVTFMVSLWSSYLFPYIARFEITTGRMLRNCVWIAFRNILWSILLVIIWIAAVLCILLIPEALLIVPAGCTLLSNIIVEHVFKKYMDPEECSNDGEFV